MSAKIAIPSAPSGVSTFTFDGHTIRVVEIKGEPWFVAKDVCMALDIFLRVDTGKPNTGWATRALNDDEKGVSKIDTLGGLQTSRVISESGLYKLILRANSSPTASAFQNWVTRDVLPTIRKSGAYVAGQETLAPAQQAEMAAMVADLVARMGVLLDREESRQKAVGRPLTGNYGSPLPTSLQTEWPLYGPPRACAGWSILPRYP